MDPLLAIAAAIGGYLIGSISFTRLMLRINGMDVNDELIQVEVEGSDDDFVSDSVGATAIGDQLGSRLGCLTALLDIAKPIVAMAASLLLLPEGSYYLLAGLGTIAGHNYPIYHRFRGGRGESILVGSFLIVDPIGLVLTQVVALLFGIAIRRVLVARWSGVLLMVPWLFFTRGTPEGLFAVVGNLFFWSSLFGELRQIQKFQSEGTLPDEQVIAEVLHMGGFWKKVEPYSIPSLVRRLR